MSDEDLLRRVLETEATKVEVSVDALAEIRRRIAARRPWWRPSWRPGKLTVFSTAAVATVAAVAVGVVSCEPNPASAPPAQPGSSRTTPAGPPPSGPPPSPAVPSPAVPSPVPVGPPGANGPTAGGTATASLAVYYVGADSLLGPRLYREFHRLATGNGTAAARTRAALEEMLSAGTARDPDYSTPWPASARVRDVRISGDTVTVDLAGTGAGPTDDRTARIAVQQLVWTATAVSGKPGVRLLVGGRPAQTLWGRVPVGGTLRRAPAQDTLALVWMVNPQDGDRVGRSVTVHVYGSVFEATIHLRVRQGGRTVTEQAVTVDAGPPAFGEATVTLTLAPGRYVLEAYEVSARDGSTQHLDDHEVTVG